MHVTSKVLPNWFWATFEWSGNPGRSDYIGSRDSFGADYGGPNPKFQAPSDQVGGEYPPGNVTPQLRDMFKKAGFDDAWTAQWLNYRLKGSQADFTDSTGVPTLLGSSVMEEGFVPSSSCITCHGRAAVTAAGKDAFPVAGFKPRLPGEPVESYNGNLDPNWFWRFAFDPSGKAQQVPVNLQTDFVWAIPFRAKSAKK
jgi:hypothetical protein